MPPFRQARLAGPSTRAGTMSTFTLGHVQVRRSGYGATHTPTHTPLGRHLTGHRLSASCGPRSPPE
jgi:hypothetical protein